MDQKKIGKFICELRKEKKMTQQELANILNVTDRAISNWENGRRMPDVSLYKALCNALDININELVNGEKIEKEKYIDKSENILIDTIYKNNKTKKKNNYIIRVLIILLVCFIFFVGIFYDSIYPKLNIYSFEGSLMDDIYTLNEELKHDNSKVFYYGLTSIAVCDDEKGCFELKDALEHNQTSIESIDKYLDSQYSLGNIDMATLWDGGTKIYTNERYSVIICNTLEGNNDFYFGKSDMVEKLDGEYCGHEKSEIKKFIKTYHIVSVTEKDDEFVSVTLKNNKNEIETVKIHNSSNLIVGKNYEFHFYTYKTFEDNIKNIFKYSTFLKSYETDKEGKNQINDKIVVNKNIESDSSLNEASGVSMSIKKGTLTKTSATLEIYDISGKHYIYGADYRIDKKEKGKWKELEIICDNCAWNSMAYGIDINNELVFDIDWARLYGKLKQGEYRIVKSVFTEEDHTEKYFSVDFEIE